MYVYGLASEVGMNHGHWGSGGVDENLSKFFTSRSLGHGEEAMICGR